MRTHTKFFNFSTLAVAGGASAVVRVAMVCNDLAIANSSLGHYKNLSPNALSRIRQGGMLNFVRMSCGHLREGMKAIRAIKNDAALSALVTRSCRFDFADVVIDTIVCRKLRAIPVGADVRAEADKITDWCCTRTIEFLTFGGDFVTRFLQEHA